jgi:CheY-like chemotaxis protein
MPDGGRFFVTGRNITISAGNDLGLAAGDYVRITFADEGCGIAEDDLEKIFDPYFTNKAGGSGLGLASTYSIIKKHDGHITVSSPPGEGAVFTIILPGYGRTEPESTAAAAESETIHGTCSILVMDDDEMVRDLADITLKRLGYSVVCCQDGAEAVTLYKNALTEGGPFCLVIMDLTIPGGMGGVEAARQILAFHPEARLIVSSGYSDDPVMANFSAYGFCAALGKPYNVEEIAAILRKGNC